MSNDNSLKRPANSIHGEEKNFSRGAISALRRVRLLDYDEIISLWNEDGVCALEEKFCRFPGGRPLVVIEIIISLAFNSVDTSKMLERYIKKLISEDAKYSEVQFWKSLKTVLQYLPGEKYTKLKNYELEQYSEAYKYTVTEIFCKRDLNVGVILPEEDYFEIDCVECESITSFFFKDIMQARCRACTAKLIADVRGFDMYSKDECEERESSFAEEMEETDVAFACKLCRVVCLIESTEDENLLNLVRGMECRFCEGEKYITWLAKLAGYSVEVDGGQVTFINLSDNKKTYVRKEDLRPRSLLERLINVE